MTQRCSCWAQDKSKSLAQKTHLFKAWPIHEQSSDQCPILYKQYGDEGTIFGSFSMPLVFTEEYQILHLYKMGLTIIIHK